MRAIVMREPGPASVLRVENVAVPVPGRRDVLIRVAACGVRGHDLVHRRGTKRDAGLPCIPGHEVAGTIVEVGSDVRYFAPGQRVATTQRYHICMACRWCRGGEETLCREMRFLGEAGMVGGYAQFVAVEEDNVAPVPDGVPLPHAAIAACAIGTVLNAVRDVAHVSLGERVLVTGAGGGLGVHAAQLARSAGAHVIAQTHSANKAAGLASLGIDDVMITAPGEDFSERVRALTGSEGVASRQAANTLPFIVDLGKQATDRAPRTVGIITDNTASPQSFLKPMREGGFAKLGLKVVVDETFTLPLSDATSMVQKVRTSRPDFLLMMATSNPDIKLVLEKLNEMGLGKGRIPVIANGGQMVAPELLTLIGPELMEQVIVVIANWPGKGHEKLLADFRGKNKEPWMPQDSISTYGDMWIIKDAMEKARSADPKKVAEAIRSLDITDSSARFFPGGRLKFDAAGRREGAEPILVQWQNGEPHTVYPTAMATKQAAWPKR